MNNNQSKAAALEIKNKELEAQNKELLKILTDFSDKIGRTESRVNDLLEYVTSVRPIDQSRKTEMASVLKKMLADTKKSKEQWSPPRKPIIINAHSLTEIEI